MKPSVKSILTILLVVILDQLTKWYALKYLSFQPLHVEPTRFFRLFATLNEGSAFSIFQDVNTLLIWISIIFLGALLYFWDSFPDTNPSHLFLSLIVGGGIGNLIDRISLGGVVDFIDFSFWPSFNLADSALSIGVVGLIALSLLDGNNKKNERN